MADEAQTQIFLSEANRKNESLKFFAGLIFAVLSYNLQHPVKTYFVLEVCDRFSWAYLFLSGLILLTKICDLRFKLYCFFDTEKNSYWKLFLIGMALTILAHSFG